MLNLVILEGRLVRDVDLRYAPSSGNAVAKFKMAVDRDFVKQGEKKEADFIDVTIFGKRAEFVSQYFKKGSLIQVQGRIQTGSYTNKEGVKVYTTDIMAEKANFVPGSKKDSGGEQSQGEDVSSYMNEQSKDGGFEFTEIDERNLPF